MVSFTTSVVAFATVACTMIHGSQAAVPLLLSKIAKRDNASALQGELKTCLESITSASKPTLTWGSSNSVDIFGLPQTCITELDEINKRPDIASLESKFGATEVVSGSSIYISNMSPQVVSWLKALDQKLS